MAIVLSDGHMLFYIDEIGPLKKAFKKTNPSFHLKLRIPLKE